MGLRLAVLATALSAVAPALALSAVAPALALAAPSSIAAAAPQRDRGLTINAVPHTIIAGEAVLISGRLASHEATRLIRLYHRIAGQPRFALIGVTRTDSTGRYEFTRAEDVVRTNRSWFVRGPALSHSSTYRFGWTLGARGAKLFRARITGGPANVGGASPAVTVDVLGVALSTLPTG